LPVVSCRVISGKSPTLHPDSFRTRVPLSGRCFFLVKRLTGPKSLRISLLLWGTRLLR